MQMGTCRLAQADKQDCGFDILGLGLLGLGLLGLEQLGLGLARLLG